MKTYTRIDTITTTADTTTTDNTYSVSIGAMKHVSDRVQSNNIALKQFYRDCKMVDRLPIDTALKEKIMYQLVATIKDCFVSLVESI